jgi:hypothetical protein
MLHRADELEGYVIDTSTGEQVYPTIVEEPTDG